MSARGRWWLPLTSSVVVVSPVLLVLAVLVTMSEGQYAEPYWLDLSSKATVSIIFLAPGFAALAAWDAARWRVLATASTRGWLELLGRTCGYVAVATSVTFALTLGLLYVRFVPEAGLPRVDVLASAVWVTVAYAALGFCLGRFLPRILAAAAAFGAVWLWVAYTPAVQPFWLRNVTGNLGTSCCPLDRELVPLALVAPTLVGGALVLGVAMVLMWPRRVTAWVCALVVVPAGIATAGDMMSSVGADPVRARVGADVCERGEGIEVCAFPEHRTRLAHAAPALLRTAVRLREAGLDVPDRISEEHNSADGWSFSLVSPEPADWPRILATSPVAALPPECYNRDGAVWTEGADQIIATMWLLTVIGMPEREAAEEAGADVADLAPFRRIRAMTPERQRAWYTEKLSAMRSCPPAA